MPSAHATHLLPPLLAQYHASVHTLIEGLGPLASTAQAEMLAAHLETYLDHLRAQEQRCLGFLPARKTPPAPDPLCTQLTIPWPAIPGEEDVLLARAALRIIHLQIASLGVLQALATTADDPRLVRALRDAMENEIESEEAISIWLDEAISPAPVEL